MKKSRQHSEIVNVTSAHKHGIKKLDTHGKISGCTSTRRDNASNFSTSSTLSSNHLAQRSSSTGLKYVATICVVEGAKRTRESSWSWRERGEAACRTDRVGQVSGSSASRAIICCGKFIARGSFTACADAMIAGRSVGCSEGDEGESRSDKFWSIKGKSLIRLSYVRSNRFR